MHLEREFDRIAAENAVRRRRNTKVRAVVLLLVIALLIVFRAQIAASVVHPLISAWNAHDWHKLWAEIAKSPLTYLGALALVVGLVNQLFVLYRNLRGNGGR